MSIKPQLTYLIIDHLNGDLTLEELQSRHEWKSYEHSEDLFLSIKASWNLDLRSEHAYRFQKNKYQIDKHLNSREIRFHSRTWMYWSVASILIVALIYLIPVEQNAAWTMIANHSDAAIKDTLPDGSICWLNKNTEIRYKINEFNIENRSVKLLGEAYFMVESNPNLPFIVEANTTSAKALGTEFNVRTSQGQVEVAVTEGSVEFYNIDSTKNKVASKVTLFPGDFAIYSKESSTINKQILGKSNYLSWKTKSFQIQNLSLDEIVMELEKTFNLKYKVAVIKSESYTITGSVKFEEPFEIILKINRNFKKKLNIKEDVLIVDPSR